AEPGGVVPNHRPGAVDREDYVLIDVSDSGLEQLRDVLARDGDRGAVRGVDSPAPLLRRGEGWHRVGPERDRDRELGPVDGGELRREPEPFEGIDRGARGRPFRVVFLR